jgi:hypothetical protein
MSGLQMATFRFIHNSPKNKRRFLTQKLVECNEKKRLASCIVFLASIGAIIPDFFDSLRDQSNFSFIPIFYFRIQFLLRSNKNGL